MKKDCTYVSIGLKRTENGKECYKCCLCVCVMCVCERERERMNEYRKKDICEERKEK